MTCALFNGSPRAKGGNTAILLEEFRKGWGSEAPEQLFIYRDDEKKLLAAFRESETTLMAFPLYTDMMPGRVKRLLEILENEGFEGKRLGVIVQSGFPEAAQSSHVVEYFKHLVTSRGGIFIGGVIRGGVEGLKIMPEKWTEKIRSRFRELGEGFQSNGKLDPEICRELAKPWKLSRSRQLFFSAGSVLGVTNMYWNHNLKKNDAFADRFARPYGLEHDQSSSRQGG